ncbi:hypothetical protein FRX31_006813 [Thalictrum thalictroides]|uniref:Uncharacterized protein n=1 Tax=Thalictrum thalictroides TaxID=46969 RepID=A0A7J6X1J0_THATH|nr:hypothetical protein FRX31_006813 [Thalictrum thalictroides]
MNYGNGTKTFNWVCKSVELFLKRIALESIAGWRVEAHERRARSERREAKILMDHPNFNCDADKEKIQAEEIEAMAEEDRKNEDEAHRERERAEPSIIEAATDIVLDTVVLPTAEVLVDDSNNNVEL